MNKKEYRCLNITIPDNTVDAQQQNYGSNHIIYSPQKALMHVTVCCLLSIGQKEIVRQQIDNYEH